MANPYNQGTSAYTIWDKAHAEGYAAGQANALTGDYFDGFNAGLDEGNEAALATLSQKDRDRLMAPEVAMNLISLAFRIIAWENEKHEQFNQLAGEAYQLQRNLQGMLPYNDPGITVAYQMTQKLSRLSQMSGYYMWDPDHEFNNKLITKRGRDDIMNKFVQTVGWAKAGANGSKAREAGVKECANMVLSKINDKTLEL